MLKSFQAIMVVTFLVSENFIDTAKILDDRRLLKQRVEAKQIIDALLKGSDAKGWKHHPATLMWTGCVDALKLYYNMIVTECILRGKNNNMPLYEIDVAPKMPFWMGNKKVHYSHIARLLAKDFEYYSKKLILPDEIYHKYGYVWPSKFSVNELETLPLEKLADRAIPIQFCDGFKASGQKCNNKAQNKTTFCGVHKLNKKSRTIFKKI